MHRLKPTQSLPLAPEGDYKEEHFSSPRPETEGAAPLDELPSRSAGSERAETEGEQGELHSSREQSLGIGCNFKETLATFFSSL